MVILLLLILICILLPPVRDFIAGCLLAVAGLGILGIVAAVFIGFILLLF